MIIRNNICTEDSDVHDVQHQAIWYLLEHDQAEVGTSLLCLSSISTFSGKYWSQEESSSPHHLQHWCHHNTHVHFWCFCNTSGHSILRISKSKSQHFYFRSWTSSTWALNPLQSHTSSQWFSPLCVQFTGSWQLMNWRLISRGRSQ